MRPDFTKMSVGEVRELFVNITGRPQSEADGMRKSEMVEVLLKNHYETPEAKPVSIDRPFQEAEMEKEELLAYEDRKLADINESVRPKRGHPGWQEYVLSLLADNEYVDINGVRLPKAAGLRRLVEVLLGDVLECGPKFIQTGSTVTVSYQVIVDWNGMGQIRKFEDIADVNSNNTPQEYYNHAAATACSRAAGRAFRAALLLSTHTAEEMNGQSSNGLTDDVRILDSHLPVTGTQMAGIKSMCSNLNIDVLKLLEHNNLGDNLESLKKDQAQTLMLQLNKMQSNGNDTLSIPDSILKVEEK